jgi:outer membrane protein assembly factor BamB
MKSLKLIFLLLVVACLMSCSVFHKSHECMACLTPFKACIPIKEVWSSSAGGTDKHYVKLTPVVEGNRIYAASYKGHLTAIDTQTGKHIWTISTKTHLTSGLDVGNGLLFVGSGEGEVLAYTECNGARVWRTIVSNEVLAGPFAYEDTVLVKSADDHLYALDIHTGRPIWDYNEELPELILRGGSSPRAANHLAVAGFADGQIAVFNVSDGQVLWKRPIAEAKGSSVVERMIDVLDNVEIVGNTIYTASYQGTISALDLRTGRLYWQREISSYAGLAVCGNRVFVTDASSHVWAFDAQTGAVIWKQDNLYGRHLTGPAVLGNTIVLGDAKGYVHWLSIQDGSFLARTYVDSSGITATPVVDGNAVYIYGNGGRLVKYSL